MLYYVHPVRKRYVTVVGSSQSQLASFTRSGWTVGLSRSISCITISVWIVDPPVPNGHVAEESKSRFTSCPPRYRIVQYG